MRPSRARLTGPVDSPMVSRSPQYLLTGIYDIRHKPLFIFVIQINRVLKGRKRAPGKGTRKYRLRIRRPVGRRILRGLPGVLLARSADHVADPLAGLLVHRSSRAAVPGGPVRLDLLENHPPQPREHGGGDHWQQYGFRFLSHSAILLTGPTAGQSRRRPSREASVTGAEYGVRRCGR